MMKHLSTPLGGAQYRAPKISITQHLNAQRKASASTKSAPTLCDKYLLLRQLTQVREAFELSDRTIMVLQALCSFHQTKEINAAQPQIVFPSNKELALRAGAMAPATLRRHVALLITAQLITRHDSPNRKRYCRRNQEGTIANAYGFDLSPFAQSATKIAHLVQMANEQARHCAQLRETISLLRRDITVLLKTNADQLKLDTMNELQNEFKPLYRQIMRNANFEKLSHLKQKLQALQTKITNIIDKPTQMSANEHQNEQQIESLNPEYNLKTVKNIAAKLNQLKSKYLNLENQTGTEYNQHSKLEPIQAKPHSKALSNPSHKLAHEANIHLSSLILSVPDFADYAPSGLKNWDDAFKAGDVIAKMLNVSPMLWQETIQTLGAKGATIAIAHILRRAGQIDAPGGYLHRLCSEGRSGTLCLYKLLNLPKKPNNHGYSTKLRL